MSRIQETFNRIQELKKERKEIQKEYKDTLTQTSGYEEVNEEIKKLREKKKTLELAVQGEMGNRYEKLEETKREIEKLDEMLTDMTMTSLMKGESIAIKDEYDVEYEPVYKISFKKMN